MSNCDFNKKLAIALGAALGVGALNSVSVSAMEKKCAALGGQIDKMIDEAINKALEISEDKDINAKFNSTETNISAAFFDKDTSNSILITRPIDVVTNPIESLASKLSKYKPTLTNEQNGRLKRIIVAAGRLAVKNSYKIYKTANSERLLVRPSSQPLLAALCTIVEKSNIEQNFQGQLINAFVSIINDFHDSSDRFDYGSPNAPERTYLAQFYTPLATLANSMPK